MESENPKYYHPGHIDEKAKALYDYVNLIQSSMHEEVGGKL